jgi:hypothetical protein
MLRRWEGGSTRTKRNSKRSYACRTPLRVAGKLADYCPEWFGTNGWTDRSRCLANWDDYDCFRTTEDRHRNSCSTVAEIPALPGYPLWPTSPPGSSTPCCGELGGGPRLCPGTSSCGGGCYYVHNF